MALLQITLLTDSSSQSPQLHGETSLPLAGAAKQYRQAHSTANTSQRLHSGRSSIATPHQLAQSSKR
jgi:hypothetical protein